MRLHLVGIFHTQATDAYSHCAFTGKALRFPKMMEARGYHVIEYANEGSQAQASEHVTMLTTQEFDSFYGKRKSTDFHGDDACIGSPGHQLFEERLITELGKRLEKEDIICHPFGHAHQILTEKFPNHHHVETGIGYPTLMPNSFKIYESYAWMHYHQGKENRQGKNYEWVVPNYFDIDDWNPNYTPGSYLAFLGRICSAKGMDTLFEIAKYSPWPIVIHGQGDPTPWSHPNIEYRGPITGKARSKFLRNARAALMPTNFTEPFGGSGVEAMLCGTPLIAVDYGAFTETIIDGVTGYRCHTLQDWIDAIDKVEDLNRYTVAKIARSRYSLETCGKKYDTIFKSINNLWRNGWYQLDSTDVINYDQIEEEEGPFAKRLAHWIKDQFAPCDFVYDLGCGPGTYVNALNDIGVDTFGYDIDPRVEDKPNLICADLLKLNPTTQAELVLCLETAEHIDTMHNKDIVKAIDRCLIHGGMLIWSAAQPGQGGVGHINCQTKEYWHKLFQKKGFSRNYGIEKSLVDDMRTGYHMGWFVQNVMVFIKN